MFLSPSPNITPLEVLFYGLFDRYIYNSYCLTIVTEGDLNVQLPINFVYLVPENTTNRLINQILSVFEIGCSDYIVHMKKPQEFMIAFEKAVHIGNTRRSDRKIIFFPYLDNCSHSNVSDTLLNVISMRESSFVANILLVLPSDKNAESFYLVTHKYVGIDSEIGEPLYLDRWILKSKKFEKNANLFPHNNRNLKGKTIRVGCFTYKPYVFLDLDSALVPSGRDGIEINLIDEFCRWVNCSVEIVREDKYQWGELYENLTGNGAIGSVVEDRADFGITALYSWYEEYRMLDFSIPSVRSAVTCVAPSPRLLAKWGLPLLPFSSYMWYGILTTFLFATIGLYIAKRCSTDLIFLTVFGIMISQYQYGAVSSWRIRSITGWLLVSGLIFITAYGGGLASTFTVPKYEASIDTVQDLVDRKLEWAATHNVWIFSLTPSKQPLVMQLVSQFRSYSVDELKKKSFTHSMAFGIEKLPAGSFAVGDYLTRESLLDMTIMLEDFYFDYCVVMMRKSSAYTERMNEFLGRLHQSGLIFAWEKQVALKHLDYKVQLEVKLSRSKSDVGNSHRLTLQDLVGIFILYLAGVFLSTLVFIIEILQVYFTSHYKCIST